MVGVTTPQGTVLKCRSSVRKVESHCCRVRLGPEKSCIKTKVPWSNSCTPPHGEDKLWQICHTNIRCHRWDVQRFLPSLLSFWGCFLLLLQPLTAAQWLSTTRAYSLTGLVKNLVVTRETPFLLPSFRRRPAYRGCGCISCLLPPQCLLLRPTQCQLRWSRTIFPSKPRFTSAKYSATEHSRDKNIAGRYHLVYCAILRLNRTLCLCVGVCMWTQCHRGLGVRVSVSWGSRVLWTVCHGCWEPN